MTSWFKWEVGRQGSGYDKMLLLQSKFFEVDCYILRFPPHSKIERHTDPVTEGKEHHRLNIVVKKSRWGGQFLCRGHNPSGRVHRFRPDVEPHAVNVILGSTRYVLSIGWLTNAPHT